MGSDDNNVYALNATTGAKLWNYTTGGGVDSSPAAVNGVVYVGSDDNNVYAIGNATAATSQSMCSQAVVQVLWKRQIKEHKSRRGFCRRRYRAAAWKTRISILIAVDCKLLDISSCEK